MMRIGIDGACLANGRGFGRFARQILGALDALGSPHEYVVFVDRPSADRVVAPPGMRAEVVELREAPTSAASATGRRRIGDMIAMGRAVARAGLDLMYFPATYTFFPVWGVPKVVVTMHDTLALAHPEWVFPTRAGRLAWFAKEHLAARTASHIVTVSETSRRDLIAWFRLREEAISVVTEGPEAVFVPRPDDENSKTVLRRYGLEPDARFFLYVGGLSPHKNLPRLIEAFGRCAAGDARLVLVGDLKDVFHTHVPAILQAARKAGVDGRVMLTGFVPDESLSYLYSRCLALVQPSLMEGFGLPPVEAMACGAPVLFSRAGSLPEVIADAGIGFQPTDVAAMAGALDIIASDPARREQLSLLGLERSKAYRWEFGARELLGVFEKMGGVADGPVPHHPRPFGLSRKRGRTSGRDRS